MKARISRFAVLILAVFCMAVYLPEVYLKVFQVKQLNDRIDYSPVRNDFVKIRFLVKRNGLVDAEYLDSDGSIISEKEYEELLPFRYYRDLEKWGVMPRMLNGQSLSLNQIIRGSQWEVIRPKMMPDNVAQVRLFPLFESASDFTKLKFPSTMFRMQARMEFINTDTNEVDEAQSRLFTTALQEKSFLFPAVLIAAGEPSCRKEFDEGYLITDSKGDLFHLKQVKGKPFVAEIPLPPQMEIKALFLIEHIRKDFYGYIITRKNELYQVSYRDNRLQKLPLKQYDPERMMIRLRYTLQNIIVSYADEDQRYVTVLDKNYNIVKESHELFPDIKETLTYRVAEMLFPFEIDLRDWRTTYFRLDSTHNGITSLIGIAVSIILLLLVYRLRRFSIRRNAIDFVLVLLTGVYGLAAVCLIPPEKGS